MVTTALAPATVEEIVDGLKGHVWTLLRAGQLNAAMVLVADSVEDYLRIMAQVEAAQVQAAVGPAVEEESGTVEVTPVPIVEPAGNTEEDQPTPADNPDPTPAPTEQTAPAPEAASEPVVEPEPVAVEPEPVEVGPVDAAELVELVGPMVEPAGEDVTTWSIPMQVVQVGGGSKPTKLKIRKGR